MTQKKLPLKPLPDGITLPEVPEGWEWRSTNVHDIVLYMPGGRGEQFVLWANYETDFDPNVMMAPPNKEDHTFRVETAIGDIAAFQEALDLVTTRVLLGMFDKENDDE